MRIIFPTLALLVFCLGLLGTGCAAPRAFNLPDPSEPSDALLMAPTMADPIEPVNRAAFALNEFLFAVAVEPATGVYNTLVPEPARTGIRNFRNNLFYPLRLFSNLLQGKWSGAGTETKRFLINTTLGVAGLGDPARHKYKLAATGEDLGQAFG
ncbi:MAG: MlaA family lipoprotein, partial [Verrucomicrobiia bacterium]